MKLKQAIIENFKGIRGPLKIDFLQSGGLPRPLTCLVGDNGSGKTTVLQAIALVLSLATRRTRYAPDFAWHGFLAERLSSLGRTYVELKVLLDDDEVQLTTRLFQQWYDSRSAEWLQSHQIFPPSDLRELTLVFEDGHVSSPDGIAAVHQFLGRYYIRELAKFQPNLRSEFDRLGDVFWFDQYRNLGVLSAANGDKGEGTDDVENWRAGVERLREYLVAMWAYHTSPRKTFGKDYIAPLEQQFRRIFPGVIFRGTGPRENVESPGPRDFYFLLESDGRVYDLAEMSSGEQAVFPLVYEFVRLGIAKSIVMIDELELHLHPPQQQALLAALPKLGPDCQYLITTHSPYLTNVIPDDQEVRLDGGQRCL